MQEIIDSHLEEKQAQIETLKENQDQIVEAVE